MNTKEDRIRADIITKYGSIPKMANWHKKSPPTAEP